VCDLVLLAAERWAAATGWVVPDPAGTDRRADDVVDFPPRTSWGTTGWQT
jgi:hypothetical protein